MNEILIRQFLGKPKQSFECNAILEQMIQFAHLMMINPTHPCSKGLIQMITRQTAPSQTLEESKHLKETSNCTLICFL